MKRLVVLLLALTPSLAAAQSDNEVVVIGTRSPRPLKDSPVPVRIVDRKEIEATGDVTAADAMARVVGVQIETTVRTGQTPQIQGFGSKHVLVLIDGRRASGRLADDFDLARIPASSIERIEVLKGASSVLYGSDAIGGVINIVTKRPRRGFRGAARLQRDSMHRDEASLSLGGAGESFSAMVDGAHQRGPSYDLDKTDQATTGSAYERSNAQLELGYQPTETLDLSLIGTTEDGTTDGVGLGAGGSLLDRASKARGRTGRLMTRWRPDAAGEVRLEAGEVRRTYGFVEDQRGGDRADRRLDSEETARDGMLIASRAYAERHETVGGVEASTSEFVTNQMEKGSQERERNSVFLQHAWKATGSLTLVPGVRYDHDSQFGDRVSKAFTTRIDPSEETVVRLSYGEGYRAPSFSELYLSFENQSVNYRVQGNPDLQPERSQSVQSSVAWQPSPALWMSFGVFDNRVRDLIGTVRSQPSGVLLIDYANIDTVRNQGAEASGRVRVAESMSFGLDYTFLRARDESKERALEGRAMHSGSVQARHEAAGLGLTTALVVNMVGRRPFYIDTPAGQVTEWAKAYRAATFRVAKKVAESVELFTGVRNLTNEGQEKWHPVPPRSYFGGVGAEL